MNGIVFVDLDNKLLDMQKLFFGFFCTVVCICAIAQTKRNNVIASNLVPGNSLYPEIQSLKDKNNNTDPQLKGFLTKNNFPTILALLTSSYPILGITPINNSKDTISLSFIGGVKLIDARFDIQKIGFLPVETDLQKKGYYTVGLQFNKNLISWLKENFIENNIATDSNCKRQLVITLQKFWFSNSTNEHFLASNPKLVTTLYYHFDIYTSTDIGYYPQKKIKGSFTVPYNKGKAYNDLTDSVLTLLKTELLAHNFITKETESNWKSPADFNDYYNLRIRNTSQPGIMPKGVYATYGDFLERNVMSDSVEMIVKYTNYDHPAPLYACQLLAFKEGQHLPCNKSWGYFDGHSLFLNTGNGFYIKLIRTITKGYLFAYLKNIGEDKIKKYILETIYIGSSPYQLLKDYTNTYALTFQLDPETGKLF